MTSYPVVMTSVAAGLSVADPIPGSTGELGVFAGLAALGWLFWKRDAARSDERADDLHEEIADLRQELNDSKGELKAELLVEREQHGRTRDQLLSIVMEQAKTSHGEVKHEA